MAHQARHPFSKWPSRSCRGPLSPDPDCGICRVYRSHEEATSRRQVNPRGGLRAFEDDKKVQKSREEFSFVCDGVRHHTGSCPNIPLRVITPPVAGMELAPSARPVATHQGDRVRDIRTRVIRQARLLTTLSMPGEEPAPGGPRPSARWPSARLCRSPPLITTRR